MGYPVKIQKVERPTNRSYYINLPTAVAEMMLVEKGEQFEWLLEDRNTLILKRVNPLPSVLPKRKKAEEQ